MGSSPGDQGSLELKRESGTEDTNFRNNRGEKMGLSFDIAILIGISPRIKLCLKIYLQKCSLFIRVKEWELFINFYDSEKCPTVENWLNKLCYIDAIEQ